MGALVVVLAGGCARREDPACMVPAAVTATATATATAVSAEAKAPGTIAGTDAPSITVTIAGVGDDHVLSLDATRGALDEPIALLAIAMRPPPRPPPTTTAAPSASTEAGDGDGPGAAMTSATGSPPAPSPPTPTPTPTKERVAITISSAKLGGEAPVPLRLLDPIRGEPVTSIEVTPGQHVYLRVVGDGLDREATYRANLTIRGADPQVYRVRITSAAPLRPLGLRALTWADTFDDWPIFERKEVALRLPVESIGPANEAFHVVVKPATEAAVGARPLPACGITVRPIAPDAVVVALPPLDPGRYVGVIVIQGEPLAIDLTLKNPFWVVWLLVAAGAGVSLVIREYVRYRSAREALERKIAAKEREIEKKQDALLAWDELSARNVVRVARGRKSYLALDDAEEILPDATPRDRPERMAIEKALGEVALPAPLRAELRARFMLLSTWCSRPDAARVDRGLAELSRAAQEGFSSELQAWLGQLRETFVATRKRILKRLADDHARLETASATSTLEMHPDLADKSIVAEDPSIDAVRASEALRVLGLLIEDARTLVLDGGLLQRQAWVVAQVEPALRRLEGWVDAGRVPAGVLDLIHCEFPDAAPRAEPEAPAAPIARKLDLRARGVGDELNAQEEILFEIVEREGEGDSARVRPFETDAPIEWIVDKRTVVARGGPRLTYVFERALRLSWLRDRHVIGRAPDGTAVQWKGRIRRPERSIAVGERTWSVAARFAATLVGVIVAGAAAVGVLWSGKPFGSAADYVGALLTGLGADLTVVGGGGKLLTTVLEAFTKRKDAEP